jgi:Ca2+-binding EF-hand superfamily protein
MSTTEEKLQETVKQQMSRIDGLQKELGARTALLNKIIDEFQTADCDGCGTISLVTLNEVRTNLGLEKLKREVLS